MPTLFLSYAREDRELAEKIRAALIAAGFDCFLDTKSLPPGQEYNARIGQAVARADFFIFLVSPAALEPGSYALTELSFAEKKWRNPAGHVVPVVRPGVDLGSLPAYIRPINALSIRGNVEAEIVAWVRERVERGGGAQAETPEEILGRWVRLNQPPLRRARKLPLRYLPLMPFGLVFASFGLFFRNFGASSPMNPPVSFDELAFIPIIVGIGAVLWAAVQTLRGLAGAKPIAAFVLDRSTGQSGVRLHLLFTNDRRQFWRRSCVAIGSASSRVFPREVGWAFAQGGMLLDFERGPQGRS